MLYCGIDLHKRYSFLTVMDQDGTVIKQGKVSTDAQETTKFFDSLNEKPLCVIEPVSQWYWFTQVLEEAGCSVKLAHPLKVKAIASARIKTDKIDSVVLAHLLRSNLLPEAYLSPPLYRDLKELVRFRAALANLRTQVKNKVHSILHKHGIIHGFSDLFGKAGRQWLRALDLSETFRAELLSYLTLIEQLTAEIASCERVIAERAAASPSAQLITSIKGFGYYTALTVVSEIGDINRFHSGKHLMSYAGLVPSVYSSGGKTRMGRITKQGSKWLRWTMVEAAHRQVQYRGTYFGRYYRKLHAKKGAGTAQWPLQEKCLQ